MLNDLGSGSNVDLCVITKEGVEYKRNYEYLQVGWGAIGLGWGAGVGLGWGMLCARVLGWAVRTARAAAAARRPVWAGRWLRITLRVCRQHWEDHGSTLADACSAPAAAPGSPFWARASGTAGHPRACSEPTDALCHALGPPPPPPPRPVGQDVRAAVPAAVCSRLRA